MSSHVELTAENCTGCLTAKKHALHRNLEIATLLECASAVMGNQDFTSAVKVIFMSCKKLIGANIGYISRLKTGGTNSKVVFLDTVHSKYTSPMNLPVVGLSAEACMTRRVVFSNEPSLDLWAGLLPKGHAAIHSVMFIPLIINNSVAGLLSLANKPGGFAEHDAELGTTIGKFASIALHSQVTTERIKESEDKYRRLVEILPEAILVASKKGIIFANSAALNLFGAKRAKDLTGRPLSTLIHPDSQCTTQCRLQKALDGETVAPVEKKIVRLDGGLVDVEVSAAPFTYHGNPTGLVIMRNLTQRKLMESQEQMTTKLEAVSILAGGIAHDFNNLLTVILGNLSIAKMYAGRNSAVFEKLREIENAAMQTKDLTGQLLTFAKEDRLTKKAVSLVDLLQEMVPFILHGTNITAVLSFPEELPPVEIDTAQFGQVIHNIVINAVQAMPDGGTIRVEGKSVQSFQSLCLSLNPGDYIEIMLSDEGCGIAQEHLERIFEPFFTTKVKGNGLGLATSYNIMKQHGGYMKVESAVGSGTTFYLYLPASDQPIVQNTKEADLYQGRGTILVMDDEDGVRKTAGEMLNMLGFEVEYARSGEEALTYYQEKHAEGKPYELVILDKTVRGGMGGQKTMEKLIFIDPDVKAIISSGYANASLLAECERFGFLGFVSKPYKIEELSNILQKIL